MKRIQPNWRTEEALQEIDDLIEEMELQGMDYDIEDYRIMPVAKLKDLI